MIEYILNIEGEKIMQIFPKAYFENITKISIDFLNKNNLKALILDIDNTLVDFDKNLLSRSKRMV